MTVSVILPLSNISPPPLVFSLAPPPSSSFPPLFSLPSLYPPDVFFGFTHIGVDESGRIGHMRRAGQAKISHACGALDFLTGLFKESKEVGDPMPDNVEAFELKKKIIAKVGGRASQPAAYVRPLHWM